MQQHTQSSTESWLPIAGWEQYYEISDHGRVRTLPRVVRYRYGFRTLPARIMRPAANKTSGHLHVILADGDRRKTARIHRLVAHAFIGPASSEMIVCHNDGDPQNNHVSNLRWDTHLSNSLDMVEHGRSANSEKTHCIRGHRLAGENLRPQHGSTHRRKCRTCESARVYAKYHDVDFESACAMYYQRYMGCEVAA